MRNQRLIVFFGVTSFIFVFIIFSNLSANDLKHIPSVVNNFRYDEFYFNKSDMEVPRNNQMVAEYFEERKDIALSELGKVLFLNQRPPHEKERSFKILIWKDGPFLERRHIRYFSDNVKHEPFGNCSSKNCMLTYADADLPQADAVVFLLHRLQGKQEMPDPLAGRPAGQRWVFLTDESPFHTFLFGGDWRNYNGVFNWSMTYKMESDIPVPYGRTIEKTAPLKAYQRKRAENDIMSLVPHADEKQRNVLVAIMSSNCGSKNRRHEYVTELKKHIQVDYFGNCGDADHKKGCPGHFNADCSATNKYYFYLSFENSNCDQYMTEKVYWNAYSKGAIPIILGASTKNSKLNLPPDSYLHTHDYARPLDLARHLILLNETLDDTLKIFHKWRLDFDVANEHAYFGSPSYHYCRICEALNYNNPAPKVYNDLSKFLNVEDNCLEVDSVEIAQDDEEKK